MRSLLIFSLCSLTHLLWGFTPSLGGTYKFKGYGKFNTESKLQLKDFSSEIAISTRTHDTETLDVQERIYYSGQKIGEMSYIAHHTGGMRYTLQNMDKEDAGTGYCFKDLSQEELLNCHFEVNLQDIISEFSLSYNIDTGKIKRIGTMNFGDYNIWWASEYLPESTNTVE